MEQNTTEQKIKLEGEIATLKREYKYAFENLARIKEDTVEIISTKDRVTREIAERNVDLVKILNDISDAKLTWALEKQKDMDELALKNSEADKILTRKSELDKQEEELRLIEVKNTQILNETRTLELKIKDGEATLKARENEIDSEKKRVEKKEVKLEKDQEEFKKKVVQVLEEAHNL